MNLKSRVIYPSSDNKGNILVSVAPFFFVWYGCVRSLAAEALGSSLASCSIVQILWLWPSGSVAICGLSCSEACEILVPGPGIEPITSPAFQGGSFTAIPPGNPTVFFFLMTSELGWESMCGVDCCPLTLKEEVWFHFIFLENLLVGTL